MLYIDLHLIHEVTSPQAFTVLRERGLPVRRPDRTLATMDHSTPTRTAAGLRRRADRDRIRGPPGRAAGAQLRRVRRRAARAAAAPARHRAHHRPGARAHAAGQDHRVRRQPHQHPRRVRRPRLRHRHHRGRPRARHAVPAAAQAEARFAINVEGALRRRRHRQGPDPRHHRQIGVAGGTGHVHRVPRRDHPRARHGRAHDGLQHVDRGRRARRHDRPRRDHLRLPRRTAARARRARPGSGALARWRALPSDAGRALRPRARRSMPTTSSR